MHKIFNNNNNKYRTTKLLRLVKPSSLSTKDPSLWINNYNLTNVEPMPIQLYEPTIYRYPTRSKAV